MASLSRVASRVIATALSIASVSIHSSLAADVPGPTTAAARPPRIGLALSGGGARGIAHIDVLKVLEELRVPVHCVTGTSMGAIVGGTFAAGTPPAEMEKSVLAAD